MSKNLVLAANYDNFKEAFVRATPEQLIALRQFTDLNIEPLVLDSSNMLVDGYKRYLLFVRNNEQRIPIIRQRKTSKVNITMPTKNTIERSLVRAA